MSNVMLGELSQHRETNTPCFHSNVEAKYLIT